MRAYDLYFVVLHLHNRSFGRICQAKVLNDRAIGKKIPPQVGVAAGPGEKLLLFQDE